MNSSLDVPVMAVKDPVPTSLESATHSLNRPLSSLFSPFKRLLSRRHTTASDNPRTLPLEPPATPTLRQKYGRLSTFLGSGAGGSCFLVQDPVTSKRYAVKRFRKHDSDTPRQHRKRLGDEYCIGSILQHPNIVRTLDLISDDADHVYEVMELCPQGDLFKRIVASDDAYRPSAPLTSDEIADIFVQLIHGVAYLHETGIAHRDLKAENCIFSGKILKIIDFGSADLVITDPFSRCPKLSKGLRGSGPYVPPEEHEVDRAYDARKADVWACGIILLAMCSRRFPWIKAVGKEDKDYAAYVRYRNAEAPMPKIFAGLADRDIRSLLLKMLHPDPDQRLDVNQVMKDPWFAAMERKAAAETASGPSPPAEQEGPCGR
ncbi:serine/threonine-protein kinase HAL4/sat4 [Thoreauomyces humboldtii]|nr:serine/threonine-protein kinase HAL4/sat4 [Thoreauomyces humboldtii]